MWILDDDGSELINLALYDSIRINGQDNGERGSTWRVEAARSHSKVANDEVVSSHLWFGYEEDAAYSYLERLTAAIKAHGGLLNVEEVASEQTN